MMILLLIVAPIDVSFTVDFSIATIDMHSAEAKTLTPAKTSAEETLASPRQKCYLSTALKNTCLYYDV
jgi:hypothetical protein